MAIDWFVVIVEWKKCVRCRHFYQKPNQTQIYKNLMNHKLEETCRDSISIEVLLKCLGSFWSILSHLIIWSHLSKSNLSRLVHVITAANGRLTNCTFFRLAQCVGWTKVSNHGSKESVAPLGIRTAMKFHDPLDYL